MFDRPISASVLIFGSVFGATSSIFDLVIKVSDSDPESKSRTGFLPGLEALPTALPLPLLSDCLEVFGAVLLEFAVAAAGVLRAALAEFTLPFGAGLFGIAETDCVIFSTGFLLAPVKLVAYLEG